MKVFSFLFLVLLSVLTVGCQSERLMHVGNVDVTDCDGNDEVVCRNYCTEKGYQNLGISSCGQKMRTVLGTPTVVGWEATCECGFEK